MTSPARDHVYRPAEGQVVPLIVLGLTDDLERALDASGIGWTRADDPEQAAEFVDDAPGAVLAYAPGVFGRAISARMTRVEAAEGDEPVRAIILLDRRPDALPGVEVDDDERRLAFRARIPLRVNAFVVMTDEAQVDALRHALATPS